MTLTDELLTWGQAHRRDLPWRRTRDPWAILVSELMLQQTQVARVEPRYHAFLDRFPTPQVCAAASVGDVIEAWAGLGYNRRAVNLHRCARVLVSEHQGALPTDLDRLLALPGVGPYTARAVLVFAFERDHGVLDTNAARFLARAVAGRPLRRPEGQALADERVPPGRAWEWNQAVLDLGATVCTKRAPRCDVCPIAGHCAWRRGDPPGPDPAHGSAGTSGRQSRFDGSDRQGRGRLVDALRTGAVALEATPSIAGWPDEPERTHRAVAGLVGDGLAEIVDGMLVLPS